MPSDSQTLLRLYNYDALNRLTASGPSAQTNSQRFYLKERLVTVTQGVVQHSVMQHRDQLLAQQHRQSGAVKSSLLATDRQRSVLSVLDASTPHNLAYPPYGYHAPGGGLLSLLAFNGECPDPVTRHYLLGNGYRAFNPVLMRFNSPDDLSPFGKGGLNAYAYCLADPVNRSDPNGHWSFLTGLRLITRSIQKFVNRFNPFKRAAQPTSSARNELVQFSTRNTQRNPASLTQPTTQSSVIPPTQMRSTVSQPTSTSTMSIATNTSSASPNSVSGIIQPGPLRAATTDVTAIYSEIAEDTALVLQHAPPGASPAQIAMVNDQMRNVRLGLTTWDQAARALESIA
jgi:RHS repeat-associated protein